MFFCFCIVFAQHTNFCVLAVGHAAVPGKETPPSQYLLGGDALFCVDTNLAKNRINRGVRIKFKSMKNKCFYVYLCDGICTEIINT